MKQKTIQQTVTLGGTGLHTGAIVQMNIHPAADNHGIKFQRTDIEGQPIIPADANRVIATNRGTSIGLDEIRAVHTVEHLLAAIVGLEIDNVLVELNGPEVPILDGSAKIFVDALSKAGIVEQEQEREYFVVQEPIVFKDEVTGAELMAVPFDGFQVTTLIDFNSRVLGTQFAIMEEMAEFKTEIAACRTFVFVHELEMLVSQNLIKGGELDNAVVIANNETNQHDLDVLAGKLNRPPVQLAADGILNEDKLLFDNEPARHKLLDVIGDLALVGKPIKGKIITTKPGHSVNVAFAKLLKAKYSDYKKIKDRPHYDPTTEPIFNTTQIMDWLPHRYPFLMVDKIIEMADNYVVGIKNITMNEGLFQGHFPGNPIFPGVLQMEAMAQVGGIFALNTVEDPGNWDTYFLKIDNGKFKNKVVPGDTMIIKMELLSPIRRGIVHMQGTAWVGNKLVSEAELTAQIVNRG